MMPGKRRAHPLARSSGLTPAEVARETDTDNRPAQVRRKHGRLALEPKHRAVDIWLPRKNTDVIGQIARGEIIRAVHDHIVVGNNFSAFSLDNRHSCKLISIPG